MSHSFDLFEARPRAVPEIELEPRCKPVSPEPLHHALWRANQVGRAGTSAVASGFAALDAVLPGGGWPCGVLSELLLPHTGVGEMRLLAPALVRLQARGLMWFDPPAWPCAKALRMLGLELEQLVLVHSRLDSRLDSRPASCREASLDSRLAAHAPSASRKKAATPDTLWALEQALKSGHVGAVLAWLPANLPADALRRLQLAAQGHEGPVFLLRPGEAAVQASPAPLRLLLQSAAPDWLRLTLLKRRGPPVDRPLLLALAPVLSAPALKRAEAGAAALLQRAAESLLHGSSDARGEDWA